MGNQKNKLNNTKKHLLKSDIIQENKEHILSFIEQLSAEDISINRQLKYLYTLKTIAKILKKDFSDSTKKDIVTLMSEINRSDYSDWTKRDFKVVLKRFYRWIRETEGETFARGEYPDVVKWISTGKKKCNKKLPEELLNIEEVKKLSDTTNNLRDRSFILFLYESGGRVGEVMNIKLKDTEFDKYGALVTLHGKTGARKIRVIASAPAISNWLLEHPKKEDKNALLFCGIWSKKRGKEVDYATFNKMLKETAKKADIDKPVNPHHFRHSRATELAKVFTESMLCNYMGWVQGSREAATYVHLCGRDTDKAIRKMHGYLEEEEEEEEDNFKPIKCPRCNTMNSPGSKFCSNCSLGLDLKTVMDFEKTKDELSENVSSLFNNKDQALATLETIAKMLRNK
jgi:integrase/recombinase XerD